MRAMQQCVLTNSKLGASFRVDLRESLGTVLLRHPLPLDVRRCGNAARRAPQGGAAAEWINVSVYGYFLLNDMRRYCGRDKRYFKVSNPRHLINDKAGSTLYHWPAAQRSAAVPLWWSYWSGLLCNSQRPFLWPHEWQEHRFFVWSCSRLLVAVHFLTCPIRKQSFLYQQENMLKITKQVFRIQC